MNHHTFTPWKIEDGKCVLLKDEWERVRQYERAIGDLKSNKFIEERNGEYFAFDNSKPLPKFKDTVVVTADPFAYLGEYSKPVHNKAGGEMEIGEPYFDKQHSRCQKVLSTHDLLVDLLELITDCPNLNFWMATECTDMDILQGGHWGLSLGQFNLKNVTLFMTVHNQPEADERIPKLLKLRELVGGIGVKYLPVEAVDFSRWVFPWDGVTFEHSPAGYCDKQYYPKFDHLWISGGAIPPSFANTLFYRDASAQATAAGVEVWNEFVAES